MVQLYSPLVNYWCTRGGAQGADAEDVAQDVFRAAAASLPDFRRTQPGDSFRGWLRGITRHKILQHFRQNRRHPTPSGGTDAQRRLEAQADPAAEHPEEEDPAEELDALHRRALELVRSEFEEKTWRAFWLTVVEGRSPVDIAAETGVSPTAVRMAKSRVLHRLKEEFGELM
jgi:RNA polymerase sigma-70 factor, ECF subfamily